MSKSLISLSLSFVLVCPVIGWHHAVSAAPTAQEPCPEYPPLINVSGEPIYRDSRGSIVDQQLEEKNAREQAPVFDFAEFVIESIDGPPPWSKRKNLSIDCANTALEGWAQADALRTSNLTDGKFSRYGSIARTGMIRTMAILALKLKAHGMNLGPHVIPWLGRLVHDIIGGARKYETTNPHPYGNIFVQDGYTTAVYCLLSRDKESYEFQNEVWNNAIRSIDDAGYLPSEIVRGRRALVYHIRWLDYALRLRAVRRALGIHIRPWEEARLKKVGALICHTLCDAKEMTARAQSSDMERPGEWGGRAILAFGQDMLTEDWTRCGIEVRNFYTTEDGGDQILLRKMLDALAEEHDQRN